MKAITMLFIKLLFAHIIFDFPLQGDFMAKAKNQASPIAGIPPYLILSFHCFLHSAAVYYLTGSKYVALFEFVTHFLLDFHKNRGNISFSQDQANHIMLKAIYGVICG